MSDASEIASPSSSDDERLVNVFRDSLRDGKVCAKLHGARGEPANGDLKLLEDKVTLVWQPKAMPLQSYMPPSVVAKLVMNGVSVMITDAKSVRTGRQTTNFVRTIKYLTTDELPESDDRISSIAESLAFEHLMNLVVFFNSVLFALEYHGMSESYAARLYLIENFLMLVYGTEFIIIGAAAGGLFSYLQNPGTD
ncbi:Voltage-gated Ion Channel (VIC) Superfamily [Phytophthora cinnamomi]|uniref:Voltage-gated Ion Channel (VIC) Superfamily n=1 Tax=Phytophthora cinnamomi TaxID=4785 RepID=UPI00355A0957|nr:Voltage-gated Ion Channel (VIC) Superfamily [Phytophthora cinnamomi]